MQIGREMKEPKEGDVTIVLACNGFTGRNERADTPVGNVVNAWVNVIGVTQTGLVEKRRFIQTLRQNYFYSMKSYLEIKL